MIIGGLVVATGLTALLYTPEKTNQRTVKEPQKQERKVEKEPIIYEEVSDHEKIKNLIKYSQAYDCLIPGYTIRFDKTIESEDFLYLMQMAPRKYFKVRKQNVLGLYKTLNTKPLKNPRNDGGITSPDMKWDNAVKGFRDFSVEEQKEE